MLTVCLGIQTPAHVISVVVVAEGMQNIQQCSDKGKELKKEKIATLPPIISLFPKQVSISD